MRNQTALRTSLEQVWWFNKGGGCRRSWKSWIKWIQYSRYMKDECNAVPKDHVSAKVRSAKKNTVQNSKNASLMEVDQYVGCTY